MKTVKCYSPGSRFPSVSVTGSRCDIGCPHCRGLPLSTMLPAENPAVLLSLARKLSDDGALGFLLSGGCGTDGVVPLRSFFDAIRSIKETTNLKINAHVGFPLRETTGPLVDSGIDTFSVTFPMSERIGKRYLGIDNALSRYEETVESLRSSGARVITHALIGLGDQTEEIAGLKLLASRNPKSLVVIIFTPLKGTPLSATPVLPEARIFETFAFARSEMPNANLVLGCMRPRGKIGLEARLIEESLDGIVMPNAAAIRALSEKVAFERHEGCCALYL